MMNCNILSPLCNCISIIITVIYLPQDSSQLCGWFISEVGYIFFWGVGNVKGRKRDKSQDSLVDHGHNV